MIQAVQGDSPVRLTALDRRNFQIRRGRPASGFFHSATCSSRANGKLTSHLHREWTRAPVYCFVDCDPYGFTNIYRTLKAGSGNAAHVNRFLCAPRARFLGVTPQDIVDFRLEDATHPLTATDVKRARDALRNDPFIKAHPAWIAAINQLLEMGVRAEQQALAKWGLNYVIDEYLPRKLADESGFLP